MAAEIIGGGVVVLTIVAFAWWAIYEVKSLGERYRTSSVALAKETAAGAGAKSTIEAKDKRIKALETQLEDLATELESKRRDWIYAASTIPPGPGADAYRDRAADELREAVEKARAAARGTGSDEVPGDPAADAAGRG